MTAGRPLKFKTPEELQEKIDAYFESLVEEVWTKIPKKDGDGKTIPYEYEWIPELDRHGKPVLKLKEDPMITGLALFINTSRDTLMRYGNNDKFSDVIKAARNKIEYYYEKSDIPPAVKIFKMKNFGWVDKQEVVTEQTIKSEVIPVDLDDRISQVVKAQLDDTLR